MVNPLVPETRILQEMFLETTGTLQRLPAAFNTPEKCVQYVSDSYRTVAQLIELLQDCSDPEARYRCKATVVAFDTAQPWSYRGCSLCYRAAAANEDQYWCDAHFAIDESMTKQYSTGTATFLLMGKTGDHYMPIPAAELHRAFPNSDIALPPTINEIRGQTLTFEVRFPRAARLGYNDLIGQAVSISDPEYMDATHGIALTQSVVLRATTSAGLTVTLWADFAKVLDPSVLAIEDASSPVVIAFGGLIVWHFNSVVSVKSSTATRIMVNPLVPETRILQEMFLETTDTLQRLPAAFNTPEKRAQSVLVSYRTVAQFIELLQDCSDPEARYRCKTTVVAFDTAQPWSYRGCSLCYRAAAANEDQYWCDAHFAIDESMTKQWSVAPTCSTPPPKCPPPGRKPRLTKKHVASPDASLVSSSDDDDDVPLQSLARRKHPEKPDAPLVTSSDDDDVPLQSLARGKHAKKSAKTSTPAKKRLFN
ncbi:hypothetical protein LINGRAHAP2_LOCUS13589 [Linum grandiflorum]